MGCVMADPKWATKLIRLEFCLSLVFISYSHPRREIPYSIRQRLYTDPAGDSDAQITCLLNFDCLLNFEFFHHVGHPEAAKTRFWKTSKLVLFNI